MKIIKLIKTDGRSASLKTTNKKKAKREGIKSRNLAEPGAGLFALKAKAPYNEKGKTNFNLRHKPGVYLIYKHNTLLYVGFSRTDVYKSLYRHLQDWTDERQQRITYKNLGGIKVRVIYTSTGAKAKRLEGALILKHKPPHNINKYKGYFLDKLDKQIIKEVETAPQHDTEEEYPF